MIGPDALATAGLAAASAGGLALVKSASVVGPLGLSPFFALAAFGLAANVGIWAPPEGLTFVASPLAWGPLLALGCLLQFGRSTKLTKPIAELLGTGESLLALVVAALVFLPHLEPNGAASHAEAGLADGLLFLTVAGTGLMALVALRTALDVLIWLSPIPFVDAMFQAIKLVLTLSLVALAIVSPWAALVVNALLLAGTFLALRWAIRTTTFGLTVAHDLTLGRLEEKRLLPRDPVVSADLGPFTVFTSEVPGTKRRARGELMLRAGRWFLEVGRLGRSPLSVPLGDAEKAVLRKGWVSSELVLPGGTVLLPPRYRHLTDAIVEETRAKLDTRPAVVPPLTARGAAT